MGVAQGVAQGAGTEQNKLISPPCPIYSPLISSLSSSLSLSLPRFLLILHFFVSLPRSLLSHILPLTFFLPLFNTGSIVCPSSTPKYKPEPNKTNSSPHLLAFIHLSFHLSLPLSPSLSLYFSSSSIFPSLFLTPCSSIFFSSSLPSHPISLPSTPQLFPCPPVAPFQEPHLSGQNLRQYH
ncbi:hypothetical protein B9Z19DRAFT_812558 [Tuber borchii]|uniref:Uncharacterized protein n=1 Tax=Tuber borchii TaxID=42251 RepID=A0A2T6ZVT2_TUBBO|nr:hypothetical protein B9Z19DRAFT_812558 [Tuber borchii]